MFVKKPNPNPGPSYGLLVALIALTLTLLVIIMTLMIYAPRQGRAIQRLERARAQTSGVPLKHTTNPATNVQPTTAVYSLEYICHLSARLDEVTNYIQSPEFINRVVLQTASYRTSCYTEPPRPRSFPDYGSIPSFRLTDVKNASPSIFPKFPPPEAKSQIMYDHQPYYGDSKKDPLLRPHTDAELAGVDEAGGLSEGNFSRHDSIRDTNFPLEIRSQDANGRRRNQRGVGYAQAYEKAHVHGEREQTQQNGANHTALGDLKGGREFAESQRAKDVGDSDKRDRIRESKEDGTGRWSDWR